MIKVTKTKNRCYPDHPVQGARVYVESTAGKAVDGFFNENKIYSLKFKSMTWNSLKKKAVESDIAELKTVFGQGAKIRWSKTAGCSCGCSPGYVVDGEMPAKYRNTDVWVEIKTPVKSLTALFPLFNTKLEAEIAKKNS